MGERRAVFFGRVLMAASCPATSFPCHAAMLANGLANVASLRKRETPLSLRSWVEWVGAAADRAIDANIGGEMLQDKVSGKQGLRRKTIT